MTHFVVSCVSWYINVIELRGVQIGKIVVDEVCRQWCPKNSKIKENETSFFPIQTEQASARRLL